MFNSWSILERRGTDFQGTWPTLPELLNMSAEAYPEKPCFFTMTPNESFSYRQVQQAVKHVAAFLAEQGIGPGDTVALSGKNSPHWAAAFFGILASGAAAVPLDFQYSTQRIASLSDFAETKAVIADQQILDSLHPSNMLSLALSEVFSLPESSQIPEGPSCDDLACLMFTSGTTGNEKAVMLTHSNIVSNIFMAGHPDFIAGTPEDIYYALLPLHHIYTLTVCLGETVLHGASLLFGSRMVSKEIIRELKEGQVTMFIGIPLLFNKILKAVMKEIKAKGPFASAVILMLMRISGIMKQKFHVNMGRVVFSSVLQAIGFSGLRAAISGGGPLSPETFRRFNELGVPFVQGYGLTETSPIITLNPLHACRYTSVGLPLNMIELNILDPDDRGIGEVTVKGPNTTRGYFRDEVHTKELFTSDGFLKTGDAGCIDKEGYLMLTGRLKSVIVTEGGKNVYPEEIEELFQLYPQIEQVLVRGYLLDESLLSEGIEALIFPNSEYFNDADQQETHKQISEAAAQVNAQLLPYQRITKVTVLKQPLETTPTKKIKRNQTVQRDA